MLKISNRFQSLLGWAATYDPETPVVTSPRLIAQPGIVRYRPFERRAAWQALDLVGKPGLEDAVT